METYYELLREHDISVTREELGLAEVNSEIETQIIENNPKKESYYWDWGSHVIYSSNNESPYAVDFDQELHLKLNNDWEKSVHTYDRILRFKSALYYLIGVKGSVDEQTLLNIKKQLGNRVITSPYRNYNLVYKYLKLHKLNKYYISIPYILNLMGAKRWKVPHQKLLNVIDNFTKFHYYFDSINNQDKKIRSKVRFPKLQYIILRLLADQNIYPPYNIPITRTIKKRKLLDPIYNDLKLKTTQ